jgi:hypothetical protein
MPKRHILSAAIRGVLILNIADAITALCAGVLGFSARSVFGDLLILEATVCLLSGGLLDFSKSAGVTQLRRLLFEDASPAQTSSRADGSSTVLTFFVIGLLMLFETILLTIVDVSLRHFL